MLTRAPDETSRRRSRPNPWWDPSFQEAEPDATSAVSFWLPTEYLEEHGPERVRNMALEIASALPFCSGNVGLSFNCDLGLLELIANWLASPRAVVADAPWPAGTR